MHPTNRERDTGSVQPTDLVDSLQAHRLDEGKEVYDGKSIGSTSFSTKPGIEPDPSDRLHDAVALAPAPPGVTTIHGVAHEEEEILDPALMRAYDLLHAARQRDEQASA